MVKVLGMRLGAIELKATETKPNQQQPNQTLDRGPINFLTVIPLLLVVSFLAEAVTSNDLEW